MTEPLNPDTVSTNTAAAGVEEPSLARGERGQISVLVILSVVPFVLLVAFIFNSAVQTSRRIEMQGAADAAAAASAVTVARGMNFIVLNNNAMAEVLSLMIAVRCIRNTARIMMIYVGLRAVATCIAAGACLGVCGNLDLECEDLTRAEFIWIREDSDWSRIDSFVNDESSGFGWTVLGVLDSLNQISKTAFSLWAVVQAREYARKNGADLNPVYGLTLPGKSVATSILPGVSVTLPIPTLPLARGPEQATAFRLESHQYEFKGRLNVIVSLYVISIDPGRWIESLGLYQVLRWANINHLKGDWGKLGAILNSILSALPGELTSMLRDLTAKLGKFLGIELLSWKSDPPRPMLLTDNPQNDLTDQRDIDERTRDNLRPYLQYLGVALGRVPNGGRIGNALFFNRPNALFQAQLTYAQADVYNPTNWDMWTQDWRAQLTRAKLFDQKVNDYLSILHIAPDFDWSFVNTH